MLFQCPHGHRQLLWWTVMMGSSLVQALATCSLSWRMGRCLLSLKACSPNMNLGLFLWAIAQHQI